MKTDWRIMGRPYRTTRRTTMLLNGFPDRETALGELDRLVALGELDPAAWVRSQSVSDQYDPAAARRNAAIPVY